MKTLNTFEEYDSPILISSKVDKPDAFGMVETSGGFLNKIIEKPTDTKQFNGFVNVGLYVITPEVLEKIIKKLSIKMRMSKKLIFCHQNTKTLRFAKLYNTDN